ncbi:MAG TPA: hypothetical protein DGG95_13615 [Cytophagales bacterium]|nr:hypothetical protein [Cytophagales bacterium]
MSDVRFKLQSENAKQKFIRLLKNVDDMSPVFKLFIEEYKEIVAANFESRGRIMERAKWANYTPAYFDWKKHSKFASMQMLELTGALKEAAINFKSNIGQKSLVMSVDGADYFYFVQERHKNPRHYFNTPDDDLPLPAWKILIKLAEDHITEGVE